MRITFIYILVLALFMVNPACLQSLQAETDIIKINLGGRGVIGPYFPTASTVANLVNKKQTQHGVRITVKSSRSSASIINTVMSGKLEFGVARVSHIYQAFNGLTEWAGNPQTELRFVFNAHAELVTLVASAESGIRTIQDLKDRGVFIGGPHSDLRHTVIDILAASGIDPESDISVKGTVIEEAPGMMHDNEIEAFFYIMGIMSREFEDLVSGTDKFYLVPITGSGVDRMIDKNPFYKKSIAAIHHHRYFANESNIQVLGVKTGMITSTGVEEETVYIVVRELFENIDRIKNQNAAAEILTPREMTTDMVAPIHPGATRFYQQAGINYSVTLP